MKKVGYEDLSEDDKALADCIGLENFKNLVRNYGGENLYIKIPINISFDVRNRQIYAEFNGRNHKQLARKYHLSISSIYRIINSFYKNNSQK